jgi:gliding motility-associated-like protein
MGQILFLLFNTGLSVMRNLVLFILLIAGNTYGQVIKKPQHDPPAIVNSYTEVTAWDICKNEITVAVDSTFKAGDTVLIIQMKGALIDTSNTSTFGTIIDYRNAGNYEFNYISIKSGNILTLKNKLTKKYDIPDGVVQLVRVPYLKNALFDDGLTCLKWDGTKGGILAVTATNGLTSLWDIDVNGMGFRGGEGYNSVLPALNCNAGNWNYPASSQLATYKGESIASVSQNIIKGKGSPAGGGGGGLSHNSGGGGGGNGGAGGMGGFQSDTCGAAFDNRGLGGRSLTYSAAADKIFLGSGGGAGHADNGGLLPLSGGNGGGMVIIVTDSLFMDGNRIMSNGIDGNYCFNADCNEGMAGGGAGGTILLSLSGNIDGTVIQIAGGKGADMIAPISPAGRVGPGGGGGGGVFFINKNSLPGTISVVNNGGMNGVLLMDGANPWGAAQGTNGSSFFNLSLPVDTVLFKPNIDSVRIQDSALSCNSIQFKGFGFTNDSPITTWQWDFGDGGTAFTQNATHTYTMQNTYTVKLLAIDVNGCRDSMFTTIMPRVVNIDAGADQTFCSNTTISTTLNATGAGSFLWSPAAYLNNNTIQNPVATVNTTTKFYLTLTNGSCSVKDSVMVIVRPVPSIGISKSNDVTCALSYTRLNATGASQYLWSPANTLNNPALSNPVANPVVTTTYQVSGTYDNICFGQNSITVNVDLSINNVQLPNSFTPNNDGFNDCFGLKYYRGGNDFVFRIFNRYGTVVFETGDPAICWDGTFKGQPADPGNYIYFLKAKNVCGETVRKGNVLLIR